MPDLSVVIPVLDEEESLPRLWPELREVLDGLSLDAEVIFVDDGSRDRSAEVVRALREQDRRVRLVRLKAHAGETAATDAGFRAAGGRWVVTMDADLQNDPRDIPALLAHLDRWDAACGWRVDRGAGDSLLRRVSSTVRATAPEQDAAAGGAAAAASAASSAAAKAKAWRGRRSLA